MQFSELGLVEPLQEALSYMSFETATPIQEQAIPAIIEGKDLLACAQTGTGKTAAFILPILHKLYTNPLDHIDTLVIAPTRELAIQIEQQIEAFGYFVEVSSMAVYGGGDGLDFEAQKRALKRGTQIIVATPGKLISHLNMGYVDFSKVNHLILDEADRMLDMGFVDDIKKIVDFLPKERQTLLFSATMDPKIRKLAKSILVEPMEISLAISKPAEGVLQAAYLCYDSQKSELIHNLIQGKESLTSIIIFASTRKKVNEITFTLMRYGHNVKSISSDLDQQDREKELRRFKNRKTRIIVATDVLSRGIDIKDINLVINYDVPKEPEDYVHRVGRTARADSTGVAITLVNEKDMSSFQNIERLIEQKVQRIPVPKHLGEGPEWKVGGRGRSGKSRHSRGRNSRNSRSGGARKKRSTT